MAKLELTENEKKLIDKIVKFNMNQGAYEITMNLDCFTLIDKNLKNTYYGYAINRNEEIENLFLESVDMVKLFDKKMPGFETNTFYNETEVKPGHRLTQRPGSKGRIYCSTMYNERINF